MITDQQPIGSEPATPSDGALVAATLGGDEQAFAHLVRRYLRKAMAVALEHVPTREDAEDVVQDTFRRVLASLDRFDPERSFEPWFFTILRNTARNAARHGQLRAHEPLALEHGSSQPDPYEQTRRGELRSRLVQAIEALPTMQRTCFRLCLVEGLTSAEAASAVGLAESTVRVHVFKARQSLQELLAGWRDEMEAG